MGQANIRGVTPNLFKIHVYIYISTTAKYSHHGRLFSVIGHFKENILPKIIYLKRIKEIKVFVEGTGIPQLL